VESFWSLPPEIWLVLVGETLATEGVERRPDRQSEVSRGRSSEDGL